MQSLEARVLMAAVPVDDLKHGPLAKVGAALTQAWKEFKTYVSSGKIAEQFHSSDRLLHAGNGGVAIEAYAAAGAEIRLQDELKALGMSDLKRSGRAISGMLPYAKIDALAALSSLNFARPIWYRTRSVIGQQDAAIRGDIARSTYGFTGSGVKVGILSDSFNTSGTGSYSADVASGDLPSGVQILSDTAGGTDEGRAMAQLVYDTAPGAPLAFATAYGGQSVFANNIRALRDAGSKVIVDDVIYFAEPMFQDGVIAQAVDNVVASNVAYFSAAGNDARQSYESVFRTGNTRTDGSIRSTGGAVHFYGGLTHDFDPGPGVDDMQSFTLAGGQSITLSFQWDQPYGTIPGSASSASDLDIYVLNSAGTRVVGGVATNNSGAGLDPIEVFSFTNTGASTVNYNLMIARYAGASPGVIKYVNFDTQNFNEYNTSSGSLFGHSNAAGAIAVGAAGWFNTPAYGVNPPVIESYSSRGPTSILFSNTGTRLGTPITRQRPQIVAPDGGNTTFFYSDSATDPDTLPNFFGTSAAAPAAGAVAALLLAAKPSLTPAQVLTTLQNGALDMDDPFTGGFDAGFDNATGYGLVRADAALASVLTASVSGTVFHDFNDNHSLDAGETSQAGAAVFDDVNLNGALDAGETNTTTSGSGAFTLANLSFGSHTIRQIAPTGYFATTAASAVSVSSDVTGVNFSDVATVYNGTAAADNYLLRRNTGNNKYEILIGASLAYTLPASGLPGISFNLLGGNDTFTLNLTGSSSIPSGGVTVDAGAGTDTLIASGTASADSATFNASSLSAGGASLTHNNIEGSKFNGQGGSDALTLNGGATVSLGDAAPMLQSLIVASGASAIMPAGNSTLHLTSLQLQGRLDLNDNDLIIDNGNYANIQPLVIQGLGGSSGITSSTSNGNQILALFDNAQVGATHWNGQTISSAAIVGKYTYIGDLNLDGQVSGDDYGVIDASLNTTPNPGVAWISGDANLDGLVTGDDYGVIDAHLGLGVGNPLAPAALPLTSDRTVRVTAPLPLEPLRIKRDDDLLP